MKIFAKGFNFGQDGPGNRLVYHLSGCNMRCIWCANPQGFNKENGTEYSVCDIVKEVESCRPMFFSGGGVTFTGGEATLWADELLEVLKALKNIGVHTCIETNATSKRLLEISDYVDYLIMDFKHYDSEKLKEYTGVSAKQVMQNFEALCLSGRQLNVRVLLVNNVNTASPEGFAEYFSRFNTSNVEFELLRYHELGRDRWQGQYKVQNGFVSDSTVKAFEECFREYKLNLIKT